MLRFEGPWFQGFASEVSKIESQDQGSATLYRCCCHVPVFCFIPHFGDESFEIPDQSVSEMSAQLRFEVLDQMCWPAQL